MRDEGIRDGDVLVVDRVIEPEPGRGVVASVDGELTVKRYVRWGDRMILPAAHPDRDRSGSSTGRVVSRGALPRARSGVTSQPGRGSGAWPPDGGADVHARRRPA